MRFIIFGLTLSSSWGNGHATLWRSLLKAMAVRGHSAVFYEKDVPWYRDTRDAWTCPPGIRLCLYDQIDQIREDARRELACADVAMCTSYCADGAAAADLILNSPASIRAFYDLDTPVTLDAVHAGQRVDYLPQGGLGGFDLVLSYTGGRALLELQSLLGGRRVVPLYGWFDPETHFPVQPQPELRGALSYLGTYASDRQAMLREFFVKPALRSKDERFLLAGAQYPDHFPWQGNIFYLRHLPPAQHPAFFCSSRATLNVTRQSMAANGYCPSGRLFEAAACGAAILSDWWEGMETFFTPGEQILRVRTADDVLQALALSDSELRSIGKAARALVLERHTAAHRVAELETICESLSANTGQPLLAAQG